MKTNKKKNADKNNHFLELKTLFLCATREPKDVHSDEMNSSEFSRHIINIRVVEYYLIG